jgi:Tol biopolymer transport system component
MRAGSIHWLFVLGLICSPAMTRADVALLGRLTAPVTGDQLTAGAQAASISPDGRYLAFVSTSTNMGQPSDGSWDVYLYDLETDEYLLPAGSGGNSYALSISEGGLAVAFQSEANDLVAMRPVSRTPTARPTIRRSGSPYLSGQQGCRGRPERGFAVRLHPKRSLRRVPVLRIQLIDGDTSAPTSSS